MAGSAEVVPGNLQTQILYGTPPERMAGIKALPSGGILTNPAEEFLMQVAVKDTSFHVKKTALHTLHTAGTDPFQLQTILLDFIADFRQPYDFRKFCVELLVQMRTIAPSLQPRLFQLLLKEGHYYFREEAVKMLHYVRVFDPELQKMLLTVIEQDDKNKAVVYLKEEVIQFLRKFTDFEIQKQIVLLALKSKSLYVRSALIHTLSGHRQSFVSVYRAEWFYKNLIQAIVSEVQATLAIDMLQELNHVPVLDYEAQKQLVDMLKHPFTFYNVKNQIIKTEGRITDPYLHWQFVQAGLLQPSHHLVYNMFTALSESALENLKDNQNKKLVAGSLIKFAVLFNPASPPPSDIHFRALGLLNSIVRHGHLSLASHIQEALVKILQNKNISHPVLGKVMKFFPVITDLKLKQDMVLFAFRHGKLYAGGEVVQFINLLPLNSPLYKNKEFQKNLIAQAFFETDSYIQQELFSFIGKIKHPDPEVKATLQKTAARHPDKHHRQLASYILYDLMQEGAEGSVKSCLKVMTRFP